MQKIIPHLWFDKEAVEAAEFYAKVFPNSKVNFKTEIKDTPSGDCDIVGFSVMNYYFRAISAGPVFTINPSLSFIVMFDDKDILIKVWDQLTSEGEVMMELKDYDFSEMYGWIKDKYKVNWQLIYMKEVPTQRVMPTLMFTGENCGKAQEAIDFYTSVFKNSKIEEISHYPEGIPKHTTDMIEHGRISLDGEFINIMESAFDHQFNFNEGVSLMVDCKDQEEIDYFWEKLSAVPEAEQCGWIKDKYGVSWQIVPADMGNLVNSPKATQAMLKMKKINIEQLKQANEK